MPFHLFTEVVINAPAAVVWDILTDFDRYGEWNPFIPEISGTLIPGAVLTVTIQPPDKKPTRFAPKLLTVTHEEELRWLGSLITKGLFDGEHVLRLDPIDEHRVRFTHQEAFTGILVPFLQNSLDIHTRAGFKAMNKALKKRAEHIYEHDKSIQ